jgi:hypothetical protein
VIYSTLCFVVATVLTLSGVWIQWHAHEYVMDAEEAMKNRKLTGEQVIRRLVLIRRGGGILILVGIGMLLVSLMLLER